MKTRKMNTMSFLTLLHWMQFMVILCNRCTDGTNSKRNQESACVQCPEINHVG